MKRILTYLLFLLASTGMVVAQNNIKGMVIDNEKLAIDGVAVILQTIDSAYVDATVTDSLGCFSFRQSCDKTYRLLFQHLLYLPLEKELSTADAGTIQLDAQSYEIGEVTVKAERPLVKVENGALSYDIPRLIKDKSVSNAFEVIKQVPGVIGTGDEVELLGAGSPVIVMNGQLTTLSVEQLITLLKAIPASRVQKVEIMYNAPAKYNIKGAMINVILDKAQESSSWQGEVGSDYTQYHYAGGKAHANLLYSTPDLDIDFLASGSKGRGFMGEEIMARHTLDDKVTEVNQSGRGSNKSTIGTMRLGLNYQFKNKDKLSASYYLNADKTDHLRTANTVFEELNNSKSLVERISSTTGDDKSTLHNVRVQYDSHNGIMAGVDFTNYRNPSFQHFLESGKGGEMLTDMQNNSKQDISQWALFLNHTHTFETGWALNYGAHGGFSNSKTYIDYWYNKGKGYEFDPESMENNRQREYNGNVFVDVSKSFGEHFSATASLKGEYFKSNYTSNGKKSTLWDDFALFPNASFSYMFTPSHILKLDVSSNKTYPSYWDITPQTTPLNSYSVVMGNPALRPYRTYTGQLLYLLKQKYSFMAFYQYEPDFFAQIPYQSSSELKNVFRYENMDHSIVAGIAAVVPFQVGEFWSSQVTLQGIRMQQKLDHFNDISFNNNKYLGQFFVNNTFILSKARPNLKLDINGYYVTGAIQGIYNVGAVYDVSAGLKWQFADDRATLLVKYDNIFRSHDPKNIEINQANQYSRMRKIDDTSYVGVSFIWKFGGYKKKDHDSVDTSRFGK